MSDRVINVSTQWGASIPVHIRAEKQGDEEVIGEVLRGDTYRIGSMTTAPVIAFDIGAHIGTFTLGLSARFPDAKIIAVEPHPRSFDLLRKNTEGNDNIHVINAAVSYERGNRLADGQTATGGGFMTTAEGWAARGEPSQYKLLDDEVRTVTFADLLDLAAGLYGHDGRIDLVKWDCEGGEVDAFRNMSDEEAGAIGDMVGEFHIEGGFRAFEKVFDARFPDHTLEGRRHEIEDGRHIGWFSARVKP